MNGELSFTDSWGQVWEAGMYMCNGGYNNLPKEHYVTTSVGNGGYYGCDHDIELSRSDLVALIAMIDAVDA